MPAKKVAKKAAPRPAAPARTTAKKAPAKRAAAASSRASVAAATTKAAAKRVAPAAVAEDGLTKRRYRPATPSAAARKRAPAIPDEPEDESSGAGSTLVVVESPAKAKTIGKYLGRGYRVKATVGHVMDLPEKKIGIDVDHDFTPDYVVIEGKEKVLADLKAAAKDASQILLATDPDREGEAIAWHVAGQLRRKNGPPVKRVLFHEITKDAIRKAITEPRDINEDKVDAQQARRVLDRLVGYKASPLLWQTVKKGLSAGRVQTVALRLIVEREREIRAFKPDEYWTIGADLKKDGQQFSARLFETDGKKPVIPNEATANGILKDVLAAAKAAGSAPGAIGLFPVKDVQKRTRRKNPAEPFTTSTMQQEAAKKLGFGSKRTMSLAQGLYEGVEIGADGAVGLITYMRTDSTRVSEAAAAQARDVLRGLFGSELLADAPRLFGKANAANAQDAHEAVRPTDPSRTPESVAKYLKPDQLKLYQLVWQRFMASQMAPAIFDTTTVDFQLARHVFRATGSVLKFQGFLALYREAREEGEGKALEDEQSLPVIEAGESIPALAVTPTQHFTEPPPRYSEASLVKALEKEGIGRPSTYASIISTLADRRYVELVQRRFFPTSLGETVETVMVKQFPREFDVKFTSQMEAELDDVESGKRKWTKVLGEFWQPFARSLKEVNVGGLIAAAHDLSRFDTERCPDCGGKLVPKGGFFGPFIACENHPKNCKYTRPLKDKPPAKITNYKCHECGAPMIERQGRSGPFLGCSKFPKCRGTRSMPTGVICPKDGGELEERRSKKRGKAFYGCSHYPNCDFVVWDKPVPEKCPECGYLGAEVKFSKTRGHWRKCVSCANEWNVEAPADELIVEPVGAA
ncbi:MAG: type I DNA topoisomerase [Gemmatimonadaceae bacterium]|nr:type I DNA topoisomerase [Gemmatimonadaceae bacterium]